MQGESEGIPQFTGQEFFIIPRSTAYLLDSEEDKNSNSDSSSSHSKVSQTDIEKCIIRYSYEKHRKSYFEIREEIFDSLYFYNKR